MEWEFQKKWILLKIQKSQAWKNPKTKENLRKKETAKHNPRKLQHFRKSVQTALIPVKELKSIKNKKQRIKDWI